MYFPGGKLLGIWIVYCGDASARERKRSSSGLNITSNRIEALSGIANNLKIIDIKDKDGNATGTRVEFLLPLNK